MKANVTEKPFTFLYTEGVTLYSLGFAKPREPWAVKRNAFGIKKDLNKAQRAGQANGRSFADFTETEQLSQVSVKHCSSGLQAGVSRASPRHA